jgi:integrase
MPKDVTGSVTFRQGHLRARLRFTDENGKRREISRIVRTQEEGQKVLRKIIRQLEEGGARQLEAERMPFSELANRYEALYIQPPTYIGEVKVSGMRSWENQLRVLKVLREYFADRKIRTITVGDIKAFADHRLKAPKIVNLKAKPATKTQPARPAERKAIGGQRSLAAVNRELELLRAMLSFAERENWIVKSPFQRGARLIRKSEEVSRERILTEDEQARLLAACVDRCEHLRPIIIAALDTAARRGELFQLRWADVDRQRRILRLTSHKGKRTTRRIVAMTSRLASEIEMLWDSSDKSADSRVFGIEDTVKKSWKTACKNAQIEGCRFHDLRHTATTMMIRAGIMSGEVMKLTGHTQPITFARYVNTDEETAQRVAEALDAMRNVVPIDGRSKKRAG